MRPMRRCKKPRLDDSLNDEDEKEEELNALVRKLPCYQGEGSKKSLEVEEDEKQLEEKLRQLVEERRGLKDQLNKVQQLKEHWNEVEERNFKVQEDRVKVEEEKAEMKKEKAEMEEEKTKMKKEKTWMEEEKTRMKEERVRVEKLIKEQESLVECPVCLSLPREDRAVPCCPKGHFVCSPCLDNLIREGRPGNCPTCRVPMGEGRSLLALTVVKNAQHECGHQGCNVKLNFDQTKEHEEKCEWRLILCPGDGNTCKASLPLCTVLTHVQTCQDCQWPPKQHQVDGEGILIKNTIKMESVLMMWNASWSTKVIQFEGGFFFFVRSQKKNGNYIVDVGMKGSQEDCNDFMVEASLLNVESGKFVYKGTFNPRPLTNQNEPTFCLSVSEESVSKAWKFEETEDGYYIRFRVKIVRCRSLIIR